MTGTKSVDTIVLSEFLRGQCFEAWQELLEKVRTKSSKEACCSDICGKQVDKYTISIRDLVTEKTE